MVKFTVYIDLEIEEMRKAYKHHYGQTDNPTKKQLAQWIASLAQADIETVLPDEYDDIEDDK